jgi:hypothetical protein
MSAFIACNGNLVVPHLDINDTQRIPNRRLIGASESPGNKMHTPLSLGERCEDY